MYYLHTHMQHSILFLPLVYDGMMVYSLSLYYLTQRSTSYCVLYTTSCQHSMEACLLYLLSIACYPVMLHTILSGTMDGVCACGPHYLLIHHTDGCITILLCRVHEYMMVYAAAPVPTYAQPQRTNQRMHPTGCGCAMYYHALPTTNTRPGPYEYPSFPMVGPALPTMLYPHSILPWIWLVDCGVCVGTLPAIALPPTSIHSTRIHDAPTECMYPWCMWVMIPSFLGYGWLVCTHY
jgi:hypothetical protein